MKIKRISDAVVRAYKMRCCHVSDTHGGFPKLHGRYDVVIHSGDFFPNSHHVNSGNKVQEELFQLKWLEDNARAIKTWLMDRPLLFVLGNHDFANPQKVEAILRLHGIDAYDLTDKVVEHSGLKFYGFPYVPAIGGNMWNYEREVPEMQVEVDRMVAALEADPVNVIVAHAPLARCLDLSYSNQILGSTVIANGLDYKLSEGKRPTHYLHGHIHEAHGLMLRNGMLVSNAAITYQILEI